MIGAFYREADTFIDMSTFNTGSYLTSLHDAALLPYLEKELDKSDEDMFIVLHTYGSHFNYHERYPAEFRIYTPDKAESIRQSYKKELRNAYDNSIRYTDYVLGEIVDMLKKKEVCASMLYLSDHGEDIFDDARARYLHASPIPTYYQLHIPYIIWFSDDYRAVFPEKYRTAMTKEGDTILGESVHYVLQPQASFVLIDQSNGYVKALSGGRGQKEVSRSLNRATNTLRQPGSTFKVITSFAPAIDTCGATLGSVYYDAPYTMGTKTFRNWYSSKGYMGYSTIRDGIVYSMNIVAVRCMIETVTPQLGVEYARNLGITSLTDSDYNASTALGGITKGVSNLELTDAFAAIANGGIYTKPVFFTQILDHSGKVLLENEPETKRVLKDSTAFLLTDAMAQSMESSRMFASSGVSLNSTSAVANIPGMSNAGKSGTTTSNNDIWFVGFTPYYTAGIWSGCDDNQKISAIGSSTSYHKKIWKKIMTTIHEGLADTGFPVPSSVTTAQICRKSGKLAIPGVCDHDPRGSAVYTEYFAKGTVPTEVCDHHVQLTVCSESGGLATEYCPEKTTRTFMVIPEGESGGTDDSKYRSPGTCTIHGSSSVVVPSDETSDENSSSQAETTQETVPETTKAAPKSPLDQVYIPRGPGYE